MSFILQDFVVNEDKTLICPSCGEPFVSHRMIEVFEREEDDAKGLHVTIGHNTFMTDTDLAGNPSPRRNGFRIVFECEMCWSEHELVICQHKGRTFVEFGTINSKVIRHD